MTLLTAGTARRGRLKDGPLPPDCWCNCCQDEIAATHARHRCTNATCDDVHLCSACHSLGMNCPGCGVTCAQLYCDRASSYVLRMEVFHEAFEKDTNGSSVVHPWVMIRRAFLAYGERPLLGEPCGHQAIQWFSYRQCYAAARGLANDVRARGSECAPTATPAVVICASNTLGWLVADWACALAALPSIVLDPSLPPAQSLQMAHEAAQCHGRSIRVVVVDEERGAEWRDLLSCESPSGRPLAAIFTTADARRRLLDPTADDAPDDQASIPLPVSAGSAAESDLVTCIFSFGTMGLPKPLWFDARRWAEWGERNPPAGRRNRDALMRRSVRVSCAALFAPLYHGLARRTAWGEMQHGGRLGLCSPRSESGGATLLDQIRSIEPTSLSAAPRFYSLYQRRYDAELSAAMRASTLSDTETQQSARGRALAAVRRLGGSRLKLVAVGGAVVPPSLLAFLRDCFGAGGGGGGAAVVSNGYGMTEVPGGIARDGVPLPGVEVKLLPLERVYAAGQTTSLDAVKIGGARVGEYSAIGEILVKTSRGVIAGSAGRAAVDADGWFHTGDLGRWCTDANGERRLQVTERIGFAVKLSNGEFFSPQHPELVYEERCASVSRCVLFAQAGAEAIVAVVVMASSVTTGDDTPVTMRKEMQLAAAAAGLRSWEVPGRVVIDPGPWNESNGLCSAHGKVRRLAIAQRHGLVTAAPDADDVAGNAQEPDATDASEEVPGQLGGVKGVMHDEGGTSLAEQMFAFLCAPTDADAALVLSAGAEAPRGMDWWSAMGGDSIDATELIAAWEQHESHMGPSRRASKSALPAGGSTPPGDPTPPLRVHDVFSLGPWTLRHKAQARVLLKGPAATERGGSGCTGSAADDDGSRGAADSEPGSGLLHDTGPPPRSVAAWQQEALGFPGSRRSAVSPARAAPLGVPEETRAADGDGPCVLLTGATGFLGPHLLSAILATSSPCPWKTVAVLARPPISRITSHVEDERVSVFAADLSLPDLGLALADRAAIQQMRVTAVLHSGAAVDHARSFDALHPTNVASATALVDLVTSGSPRAGSDGAPNRAPPAFILVSTMSVIPVATAAAAVGWRHGAEPLVPPACAGALESGYAQSKLIAEHHLAAVNAQGDIRLTISRLGLIGAAEASVASGCDRLPLEDRRDWLSLLLRAVEATGASPAGLTSGERSIAVLPVDLAATALAAQAACALEDCGAEHPDSAAVRSGDGGNCATDTHARAPRIFHLDAMAFGIAPRPLKSFLDSIDAGREAGQRPLQRELPYGTWRRLAAAAGPPASLALAMLPPEGPGGSLRLPSGARRRLRDLQRQHATLHEAPP